MGYINDKLSYIGGTISDKLKDYIPIGACVIAVAATMYGVYYLNKPIVVWEVEIKIGGVNATHAAIDSGLNVGDKVIIGDPTKMEGVKIIYLPKP